MKRKVVLSIAILCVVVLSFMCFSSYAVEDVASTESNMLISTLDEKLDSATDQESADEMVANPEIVGDQYLIANTVSVPSGIYDGNMYIMGLNVTFSGANVKGNVYVIASELTFDATTISGSLYTIAGKMEGKNEFNVIDVYAIAQILNMNATTAVNRSFKAMGSQVSLNGTYAYDVDLLVGDSTKNYSNVNIEKWQDIISTTETIKGELTLGNELSIGRNFNYTAKEEAVVPSTASIGNVNYSVLTENSSIDFEEEKNKFLLETTYLRLVIRLINTVFITLILGWASMRFRRLNQYHSGVGLFFKSILKGSLGAFWFLLISILLLFTGAFSAVGAVGVTSYIFALGFALPIAANMIAINILGIKEEADEGIGYKVAMLGVALVAGLVIWLMNLIPVAGGIVTALFVLMGIGGFMDLIFGNPKKLQLKYQDKMGKKFKVAKVTEDNRQAQTEEPKIDDSEAFGNTSVMTEDTSVQPETQPQTDIDSTINSVVNTVDNTTSNVEEVKNNNENEDESNDDKSEE